MESGIPSQSTAQAQADARLAFDAQPIVATLEVDRFCEKCGYNLRTQPARRDPRTEILLCRCPECGHFEYARDGVTAGRVWANRLGTVFTMGWMVGFAAIVLALGASQIGITMGTLGEMTTYRPVAAPSATAPASQPALVIPTSIPAITTVTRNGLRTTTIMQQPAPGGATVVWKRQVREPDWETRLFLWLMRGLSFVVGYALVLLVAVAAHHWPRWAYVIPPLLAGCGAGVLAWIGVRYDMPDLLEWARPVVVVQAAVFVAGGLVAVPTARPLARLAASILLPPRLRQVVAFLWLADGKPPIQDRSC